MKRPSNFDEELNEAPKKSKSGHRPLSILNKRTKERQNAADTLVQVSERTESPKLKQKRLDRRQRLVERAEMKRFTREQRIRRIILWSSFGMVVVFAAALVVAVFSPLFAIRNVAIEGAKRLNIEAVEGALTEQFGTPLPLLDRSRVGDLLAQFSLIESYSIESILPDTLQIRIVERTPIVAMKMGERFALIDAAGVMIEESTETYNDYPMLELGNIPEDTALEETGFGPAVNVLRALPTDLYLQVKSITATTTDDVTFVLRDKNKSVLWGNSSQPELKAKLLAELLESVPKGKSYDVSSTTMPSVK